MRMVPAVRVGDMTRGVCAVGSICCPHMRQGKAESGSSNVRIEGKQAFRLGDIGKCNCPHGGFFQAIEGSRSVFINHQPAVRIKDQTQCQICNLPGTFVAGSSTVFIGD